MIYHGLPDNIILQELVSPAIHKRYGPQALQFIDPRVLATLGYMRNKRFKRPTHINTWHYGGIYRYRGYRESDCGVGAPNSQHRHGRGIDCDIDGMTAEEVRADITQNPDLYPYITSLEAGSSVTWLHFDVRNHDKAKHGLNIFYV